MKKRRTLLRSTQSKGSHMRLQTFDALEYDALREHLARFTQSPLGRSRALALEPSTDVARIRLELGGATEAVRYMAEHGRFGLGGLADPEPLLDRLRVAGVVLDASELLDVARYMSSGIELRHAFSDVGADYPLLAEIAAALPDLSRALAEIRSKILPTGEVNESASSELRR